MSKKINITKKFLTKEYTINKKSTLIIAKIIGCSKGVILRSLKLYKIKIRTISEAKKGKNSSFYKHGRTLKTYFCIDCGKKLSNYKAKRCSKCAGIISSKTKKQHFKNPKNHPSFIDGRTFKIYHCIDCNKEISRCSGYYGQSRCQSCSAIERLKNPENHPNFQNGISFEPYPIAFSNFLKEQIRQRDNYICQKCRITEEEHLTVYGRVLCIHHIDYNKENCKESNLITLCGSCNTRVNFNRDYWTEYFQNKVRSIYV